MTGEHYKMKARYIEEFLFDELVATGIPLMREHFDVVE